MSSEATVDSSGFLLRSVSHSTYIRGVDLCHTPTLALYFICHGALWITSAVSIHVRFFLYSKHLLMRSPQLRSGDLWYVCGTLAERLQSFQSLDESNHQLWRELKSVSEEIILNSAPAVSYTVACLGDDVPRNVDGLISMLVDLLM